MSGERSSIGGTLTTGIQDISALLPIIGTEQCEKHVGSALEGGYLYAAATPLSIFGSLGIVKTGMSVLVASVSLPRPVSSFTSFKFPTVSMRSSRQRWLGARVLDNAGFKPMGTVAPMIGMDGARYKAETRLLEILEEKHIDNPEKVLINWRIRSWNTGLVLCTLIGAAFSIVPYIHLILRDISRPVLVPWTFPVLRTVGSSLAVICCQFLIQSRIVALMKNRVVFMVMNRVMVDHLKSRGEQNPESRLRNELQWSSDLPAEECLWRLKQWARQQARGSEAPPDASECPSASPNQVQLDLLNHNPGTSQEDPPSVSPQQSDVHPPSRGSRSGHNISPFPSHNPSMFHDSWHSLGRGEDHFSPPSVSIEGGTSKNTNVILSIADEISVPMQDASNPGFILQKLCDQEQRHLSNSPCLHSVFIFSSWILLFLSLPAAIAGYIGCFTLVSSSTSRNGPLIWLALEAALSILRILLWAANPSFDEKTEVTVEIELSEVPPLVTTEMDVDVLKARGNILNLVPERQFLEHITPFTGPLPQFPILEISVLYFTLSGVSIGNPRLKVGQKRLFMSAFDLSKRTAVTLHLEDDTLVYSDSLITCDSNRDAMQAELKSSIPEYHPRRRNRLYYFEQLATFYYRTIYALSEPPADTTAMLRWRWSLSKHVMYDPDPGYQHQSTLRLPPLTPLDRLYLKQGYGHHLKTKLVENWGTWISFEMDAMQSIGRGDCYDLLVDPNSQDAEWELNLLSSQLLHELFTREVALFDLSARLEDILSTRIESFCQAADGKGPGEWHLSELKLGRRKYLQEEGEQATKRMDEIITAVFNMIEPGKVSGGLKGFQEEGQRLIEKLWLTRISEDTHTAASHSRQLQECLPVLSKWYGSLVTGNATKLPVDLLERFSSWKHFNRRNEMNSIIERIRNASFDELTEAYKYEEPSSPMALAIHSRFLRPDLVYPPLSPREKLFVTKHSSPAAADLRNCSIEIISEVVRKPTCCSVLGIHFTMIKKMPEVNHLFYVGYNGKDITPPFALQNRARWWREAEHGSLSSSIVYFTPPSVNGSAAGCRNGTIARIMIYIHFSTQPRLRFVHRRGARDTTISIMECGTQLHLIQSNEIPQGDKFGVLDIELDQLEQGKHELEVVVAPGSRVAWAAWYQLRDIVVDVSVDTSTFADGGDVIDPDLAPMPGENPSADMDGGISDSEAINKSDEYN